ncbi:hypothetical protein [Georgenia sp. MJ170]|uniref:hypothetical protein n=1 Tax=Georgenia sunbinii TaxID=3117728 RepID=UPI002F2699E2
MSYVKRQEIVEDAGGVDGDGYVSPVVLYVRGPGGELVPFDPVALLSRVDALESAGGGDA